MTTGTSITSIRHTESPCLNCGKALDASSMVGVGEEAPAPDAGDLTVCLYCRHVMVYNADLSLRNPTDKEIVEIAGDPRLVSTVELMSAYQRSEELEARRKAGCTQVGDQEVSRQIHRAAWRAAIAFLKASGWKGPGRQ